MVGTETSQVYWRDRRETEYAHCLLSAAYKAKGDTTQLPKISWETVFASLPFCALEGGSFQGGPWYFACLHGVWQNQPLQMCSTTAPGEEDQCQET